MKVLERGKYVVGFVFDPQLEKVALLLKRRPDFMSGKFNGVGGKVEESDPSESEAMSRECGEEIGLVIPSYNWLPIDRTCFHDRGTCLYVYAAFYPNLHEASAKTDEELHLLDAQLLISKGNNMLFEGVQDYLQQAAIQLGEAKWQHHSNPSL